MIAHVRLYVMDQTPYAKANAASCDTDGPDLPQPWKLDVAIGSRVMVFVPLAIEEEVSMANIIITCAVALAITLISLYGLHKLHTIMGDMADTDSGEDNDVPMWWSHVYEMGSIFMYSASELSDYITDFLSTWSVYQLGSFHLFICFCAVLFLSSISAFTVLKGRLDTLRKVCKDFGAVKAISNFSQEDLYEAKKSQAARFVQSELLNFLTGMFEDLPFVFLNCYVYVKYQSTMAAISAGLSISMFGYRMASIEKMLMYRAEITTINDFLTGEDVMRDDGTKRDKKTSVLVKSSSETTPIIPK